MPASNRSGRPEDITPPRTTLDDAQAEIGRFFRSQLDGHGLQHVSLNGLRLNIESAADLFMPESDDEFLQWQHESDQAQKDFDRAAGPFGEFSLTHADAFASKQDVFKLLTDAAYREVDGRFEGWRQVVVGVSAERGVRLVSLSRLNHDD